MSNTFNFKGCGEIPEVTGYDEKIDEIYPQWSDVEDLPCTPHYIALKKDKIKSKRKIIIELLRPNTEYFITIRLFSGNGFNDYSYSIKTKRSQIEVTLYSVLTILLAISTVVGLVYLKIISKRLVDKIFCSISGKLK